jgi:hypothetical protein
MLMVDDLSACRRHFSKEILLLFRQSHFNSSRFQSFSEPFLMTDFDPFLNVRV